MTGSSRREILGLLASAGLFTAAAQSPTDYSCPMDPDVRSDKPGKCPRCGMQLRLHVPERKEFSIDIHTTPQLIKPGADVSLSLTVCDPDSGQPVSKFDIVHEKLLHLFLVHESLEYFAHQHPVLQPDSRFVLKTRLPQPGMYRLLADFYPSGSVPQLAQATLFAAGMPQAPNLKPELATSAASNLQASLKLDPAQPIAGLETKLIYTLQPAEHLEPYLGAWAHMLAASADLIDLMHVHPFLADGNGTMQFNVIFPRSGLYRIWTQFQRAGTVNTTRFTIPVSSL